MAAKRRHDSESLDADLGAEEEPGKKIKADKNGASSPLPPAEAPATDGAATDVKIAEVTNETIKLEWESSDPGKLFVITLEETNLKNESVNIEATADSDKKCIAEFSDLTPLTKYTLTISSPEKEEPYASIDAMTRPSLEMPEIEEVQEGCAYLTLAALPEDQAKDIEAYLLLVRPLEDAEDYPEANITDPELKSKLESIVKPPFYLVHELTQDDLTEENGLQVHVGSGEEPKEGNYGTLQNPRLTSGGNYRAVVVVVMNLEGELTLFAEESCQMLVK